MDHRTTSLMLATYFSWGKRKATAFFKEPDHAVLALPDLFEKLFGLFACAGVVENCMGVPNGGEKTPRRPISTAT
jgi:hypothetical protein